MFGKETRLSSLAARRQLLVLESELNRVLLMKELDEWKAEADRLAGQARVLGGIASSVGSAVEMLMKNQQLFSGTREKFPRLFGFLRGARAGASLWSAIRSWTR